ncbi:MAG TPA: tRNA (guanosine(37)-N1)-methyltransferase TrmD [Deltaproteobacteria bacterium]|jgi:tRNA (guanine37-N1)-methyltransferase|nr:tRNA (guanosine(37)-N1)-methyltransferase TrmD [Deltaproteobacteria bacterium]
MDINIITLFPDMFQGIFAESILHRAIRRGLIEVRIIHLRPYGIGKHRVVDDTPYGGGGGMILKPEPIARALEDLPDKGHVVLTTPRGRLFRHTDAARLSAFDTLTIICGHYEGVDERVSELFVDEELSIGDYVLTGGELPAMVIVDAVARLIPGVLGRDTTISGDSHYEGILEYPHYTKPREFRGLAVPDVLLSGNHEQIEAWRKMMARKKTEETRPDLLGGFSQGKTCRSEGEDG